MQFLAHQTDQLRRRTGLGAKCYVETFVLVFGFSHATDHDHRDIRPQIAKLPHEHGAAGSGHDVIGDNGADGVGRRTAQKGKRAVRGGSHIDRQASIS